MGTLIIGILTAAFVYLLVSVYGMAFGQVPPVILSDSPAMGEIFGEVVKVFAQWEGLNYQYQISAVLFIVVGLFKNSAGKPTWDKLGKFKPLVAPTLSMIAFLFLVQPFTLNTFIAAITTGVGAGYFAQLLDALKTIPAVGSLCGFISGLIGKVLSKPE